MKDNLRKLPIETKTTLEKFELFAMALEQGRRDRGQDIDLDEEVDKVMNANIERADSRSGIFDPDGVLDQGGRA